MRTAQAGRSGLDAAAAAEGYVTIGSTIGAQGSAQVEKATTPHRGAACRYNHRITADQMFTRMIGAMA